MAFIPPQMGQIPKKTPKINQHVDYKNLPCPLPYEEFSREAHMALKLDSFEGARVGYVKALSNTFFLTHSASMGNTEVPVQDPQTYKTPIANYEFGATYADEKKLLLGRMSDEGRLSGRFKYNLIDALSLKADGQLIAEPHMSNIVGSLDYKGSDYRAQLQVGSGSLYSANYMQSVTPKLSLGGEIFYTGAHMKSGAAAAARYSNDKMVCTGQCSNTGSVALTYVQKVTAKVSAATELMYNYISRDVTATVGYDAMFRQARVRGKIDTNGCVTATVENKSIPGLGFLLSAEIDHWKKDYKLGFGTTIGE